MNLPGIYPPAHYTVGLYAVRDRRRHRRWLVRLRLPEGGFVTIAEYRTGYFAQRLVNRSWKYAETAQTTETHP